MYLSTISEWLAWIDRVHPQEMALGLERVSAAAKNLGILSPACPVIIVGGTNGKGSTVFTLEAIYRAAGYKTGAFISPVLFQHNEQVRIDGEMASDAAFCKAFAQVEAARGDVLLTPFEFHTLAALCIFKSYPLDILILEVGLGGRLDAVNMINADVAVVASVSIDHVNWLGDTREKIGYEKAGIFRGQQPAVCGDIDPPETLVNHAKQLGALLYVQGRDFIFQEKNEHWSWQHGDIRLSDLPKNALMLQNMSSVLMVVTLLEKRLPVNEEAIKQGLSTVHVPGRIQVIDGPVTEIYDVSHNLAAVALLKKQLEKMPCLGKTLAVFSMLDDKDMDSCLLEIRDTIDTWYVAPLHTKRAASEDKLNIAFKNATISQVEFFLTIKDAYQKAKQMAERGDRLVVFGSFHTIKEALE